MVFSFGGLGGVAAATFWPDPVSWIILFWVALFVVFSVLLSMWGLVATASGNPHQFTMAMHVGPLRVAEKTIRADQVRAVLVETKRFCCSAYSDTLSGGRTWRWQVVVSLALDGELAYQVDHSSDAAAELALADRIAKCLDKPVVQRLDPEAQRWLEGAKRTWRRLALILALVFAVLLVTLVVALAVLG